MRVIETIHGENTRKYSCDSALVSSGEFISSIHCLKDHHPDHVKGFFKELNQIPLVTNVYVSKYVVEIHVVEAFAGESYTWDCVQSGVDGCLKRWFGTRVQMTLAPLEGKEKFISEDGFGIPHDFKSHRDSWRSGLVKAKELDMSKSNNCAEHGDNEHYWDHEIMVFDAAFDTLEALNLPEK